MTVQEIVRFAKIAVELGIARIKLTGGEPLMRKDLPKIVSGITLIEGLRDLSLTTNGNISLPTLNTDTYHRLTGGNLQDALSGVKAAIKAGFCPVKLNMVILKDVNVSDVPAMIEYAAQNRVILQLIELDPINVGDDYYATHHRSLDEQERLLREKAVSVEQRPYMHNRLIYHLPNVTVEAVHPIENSDFCMHCTRMRITSDGKLKPCLMRNDNLTDILTPMRRGADDEELKSLFIQSNMLREPYNKSA
jgi:cyclic pyranopterin phosphate synthase